MNELGYRGEWWYRYSGGGDLWCSCVLESACSGVSSLSNAETWAVVFCEGVCGVIVGGAWCRHCRKMISKG